MLYLKAKAIKQRVKDLKKQINKEALVILDRKVSQYINSILENQKGLRITAENIYIA